MEHIIARTAWRFLLAVVITMLIAGIIMMTVGNIAAATAVCRFFSSLAGPGPNTSGKCVYSGRSDIYPTEDRRHSKG